jgi:acetolactate synthase-1/2/3 large subunit
VLLVVDDAGYGILREYQQEAFGETTATWLEAPDFAAVAQAFGVRAETTTPTDLGEALARAHEGDRPALVHLRAPLRMWTLTA